MGNVIESLFISVLFDDTATKKSANKTQQTISNFVKKALVSFAALTSFDALKNIANEFEQNANKLGDIADKIGENVENVDAFRKAVVSVNGDAEQFTGTLTDIGMKLKKINTIEGRQFTRELKRMGISVKDSEGYMKNATDIIVDYADKYNKLTGQKRENFVKMMGIDESTEKLLKQGKNGVNKLVTEMYKYGVVSKEQVKIAKEFRAENRKLEMTMGYVFNKIGSFLLPVFTKFNEIIRKIVTYLSEHQELVKGFFIGIATVLTARVIPAFIKFAAAVAINPFFWMIAGLTALIALFALVFEDFKIYKETGESFLKPVYQYVENTINVIKDFINTNSELIEKIKEIGIVAFDIFYKIGTIAFKVVSLIWSAYASVFGGIIGLFVKFYTAIYDNVINPIIKLLSYLKVIDKLKNVLDFANSGLDKILGNKKEENNDNERQQKLNSLIKPNQQNSPASQVVMKSGLMTKNNTIKDSGNQINNITVNSNSENASKIANDIKDIIPKNKAINTLAFDNGSFS